MFPRNSNWCKTQKICKLRGSGNEIYDNEYCYTHQGLYDPNHPGFLVLSCSVCTVLWARLLMIWILLIPFLKEAIRSALDKWFILKDSFIKGIKFKESSFTHNTTQTRKHKKCTINPLRFCWRPCFFFYKPWYIL